MVNGTSILQSRESFFLLDFLSTYPQIECGASSSVDVGLLSVACILPYPVWVGMLVIVWYSREFYFSLTQFTITLMTVAQISCQYYFARSPPILGCGPPHSWPCPQVTLVTFGFGCLLRYSVDISMQPDWKLVFGMSVVAFTMHAVIYIGFADATSVLGGTILGSFFAYAEHEVVLVARRCPLFCAKLIHIFEMMTQRTLIDTLVALPSQIRGLFPTAADNIPETKPNKHEKEPWIANSNIEWGQPKEA